MVREERRAIPEGLTLGSLPVCLLPAFMTGAHASSLEPEVELGNLPSSPDKRNMPLTEWRGKGRLGTRA